MRIALTLMDQTWENKSANVDSGNELTIRSLRSNADLIIFPEMTLTGFTSAIPKVAEESGTSTSLRTFADMAAKYGIGVVAGVILKTNDLYHNCAVAVGRGASSWDVIEKSIRSLLQVRIVTSQAGKRSPHLNMRALNSG